MTETNVLEAQTMSCCKIPPRVQFIKITHSAVIPEYAHDTDAGADICSDEDFLLVPHDYKLIRTGIKIALPEGYEAQVRPRSGLALRAGVTVLNAPGTIDAGYRGEVKVLLINHGFVPYQISKGSRIAQLVVSPVSQAEFIQVDTLEDSDRGIDGFGSTGFVALERNPLNI